MDKQTPAKPLLQDILLRALRIAASTFAIVKLLHSDWSGVVLAALACLVFLQVERLRGSTDEHPGHDSR